MRQRKFEPKAGEDLLRVMTRAGDAPDFSALEARLRNSGRGATGVLTGCFKETQV